MRTRITDLLGCKYPIMQAGMGGPARSELCAAVTIAGGYGCLGMVGERPELIRKEIAAVRDRTDQGFGINLVPFNTNPVLLDEQLEACFDAKVPLTFFWDVRPRACGARSSCRVPGSLPSRQCVRCDCGRAGRGRCGHRTGRRGRWTCPRDRDVTGSASSGRDSSQGAGRRLRGICFRSEPGRGSRARGGSNPLRDGVPRDRKVICARVSQAPYRRGHC